MTELKITDLTKISNLIDTWITCLRISGNVVEDAANTFRLEYAKIINPDYLEAKALKSAAILKNFGKNRKIVSG